MDVRSPCPDRLFRLYEECPRPIWNSYARSRTLKIRSAIFRRRRVMGTSMKFVIAIIKPLKLDDVLEALAGIGIQGVTVTETKDYGQRGQTEIYRGLQYTPKFLSMLKIEAAVKSDQVAIVTESIMRAAKTGQPDDGKIFVLDLENERHMRIGQVDKMIDEITSRRAA